MWSQDTLLQIRLMNLVLTSVFRAGDITCISWAPKAIHMGKLPSSPSLCSMYELYAHLYTFSILEP